MVKLQVNGGLLGPAHFAAVDNGDSEDMVIIALVGPLTLIFQVIHNVRAFVIVKVVVRHELFVFFRRGRRHGLHWRHGVGVDWGLNLGRKYITGVGRRYATCHGRGSYNRGRRLLLGLQPNLPNLVR